MAARGGLDAQPAGSLEEDCRIGLTLEAESVGLHAIHTDGEQVRDAGGVEHLGEVPAGRDDRGAYSGSLQRPDQVHGSRVRLDSMLLDVLEEVPVLAVAEPSHGLPVGRVVRISLGKHHSPRAEEVPDSVRPWLAVHVSSVVAIDVERPERLAGPPASALQVAVEEALPGRRMDGRGVGDDAVHVEDDGRELLEADRRRDTRTSGAADQAAHRSGGAVARSAAPATERTARRGLSPGSVAAARPAVTSAIPALSL